MSSLAELLAHVQDLTGHRFADLGLLLSAFTHASYTHEHPDSPHNERLEFLGDAVLDLAAAVLVMERFDSREGQLTELRQHLVRNRNLGVVGKDLGLDRFIRLGRSEAHKEEVEPGILGDCVEALLGALFTEAGMDCAMTLARRCLSGHLDTLEEDLARGVQTRSVVNRLQEYTQKHLDAQPSYEESPIGEAEQLRWSSTVIVNGESLATGDGQNKKEARRRAAALALEILHRRAAETAAP